MLLSRKFEKEEGEAPGAPFKASLHIAKQRNGPTGKVGLVFHGAYTRYEAAPPRSPLRSPNRPQKQVAHREVREDR